MSFSPLLTGGLVECYSGGFYPAPVHSTHHIPTPGLWIFLTHSFPLTLIGSFSCVCHSNIENDVFKGIHRREKGQFANIQSKPNLTLRSRSRGKCIGTDFILSLAFQACLSLQLLILLLSKS